MRNITGLEAHIASETTTIATCWRVQRIDGRVFCFTDHDVDLVVAGETYLAETGFTRSAATGENTLAVDNLEIIGLMDSVSITDADLRNGLWDYAECRVFLVNWQDPDAGHVILRRGYHGECKTDDAGRFIIELKGMAQLMTAKVGSIYSPECRAQLGDERCKVNLTPLTKTGVVGVGSSKWELHNTTLADADGWFEGGVIVMTSGLNNGVRREVLTWSSGVLTPFLPLPYEIAVGDTFSVTPGCDRKIMTCRDKFNNVLNNRSEPYVPGQDAYSQFAIPGVPLSS